MDGFHPPLDNEIIRKLFKRDIREGEEKLMLAVLSDAIELFQKHVLSKDEKGRNLFREVEEWFLEKENDQLFSFEYICETLELHPDYIRQGLISWKEARLKEYSLEICLLRSTIKSHGESGLVTPRILVAFRRVNHTFLYLCPRDK